MNERSVRIYQPSKTAMQSGRGKTHSWILEYEQATPRRPEALMGWTASADTLNQVQIRFDNLEDARSFAEEKGWSYTVIPPRERKIRPRNYGDNFKYLPPEES